MLPKLASCAPQIVAIFGKVLFHKIWTTCGQNTHKLYFESGNVHLKSHISVLDGQEEGKVKLEVVSTHVCKLTLDSLKSYICLLINLRVNGSHLWGLAPVQTVSR